MKDTFSAGQVLQRFTCPQRVHTCPVINDKNDCHPPRIIAVALMPYYSVSVTVQEIFQDHKEVQNENTNALFKELSYSGTPGSFPCLRIPVPPPLQGIIRLDTPLAQGLRWRYTSVLTICSHQVWPSSHF